MFSMNQARYSTVTFLRGLCKFAISTTATTCQFSIQNFLKTRHERSLLHSPKMFTHTPEVYRKNIHRKFIEKNIHRNWKFTHKKHIRPKLFMTPEDNNTKRRWDQVLLFRLHEQSTALSKYPLYFVVALATTN